MPLSIEPKPKQVRYVVHSFSVTTTYARLCPCAIGEWVLVHGAAGGVGIAACQIAKCKWIWVKPRRSLKRPARLTFSSVALGCKVIAAASSEAKRQFCKDHGGVDEVVDYTKEGWQVSVHLSSSYLGRINQKKKNKC